ncbi:unnamed protein product [Closterium sp. NIES-64]|nr:unnamed protein product [Closterium sp. NIES-65]CAI6003406.1 unnamed protein product [Closterium sp. NIES-64]
MASRVALALLATSLLLTSAAAAQFAPRPSPDSLPKPAPISSPITSPITSPSMSASTSPVSPPATTFRAELKQVASILAGQPGYSLPAKVFSTLSTPSLPSCLLFAPLLFPCDRGNFPNGKLKLVENTTVLVPTDSALAKFGLRALFNPKMVTKLARYNIIRGRFSFGQMKNLPRGTQLRSLYKNRPVERKAVSPAAKDWVIKNKDLLETNFFQKFGTQASSAALNKLLPPAGNEVGFGRPNSGPLSWVRVDKPDLFSGKFIKVHGVDNLIRPPA